MEVSMCFSIGKAKKAQVCSFLVQTSVAIQEEQETLEIKVEKVREK